MAAGASRPTIRREGVGEYLSSAVVHSDVAYIAGQFANRRVASIADETRAVLDQIDARLHEVGTDRSRLLTVSIYLADIDDFAEMNAAWIEWLDGAAPPARVTVQTALASPDWRVEMAAVAAV